MWLHTHLSLAPFSSLKFIPSPLPFLPQVTQINSPVCVLPFFVSITTIP